MLIKHQLSRDELFNLLVIDKEKFGKPLNNGHYAYEIVGFLSGAILPTRLNLNDGKAINLSKVLNLMDFNYEIVNPGQLKITSHLKYGQLDDDMLIDLDVELLVNYKQPSMLFNTNQLNNGTIIATTAKGQFLNGINVNYAYYNKSTDRPRVQRLDDVSTFSSINWSIVYSFSKTVTKAKRHLQIDPSYILDTCTSDVLSKFDKQKTSFNYNISLIKGEDDYGNTDELNQTIDISLSTYADGNLKNIIEHNEEVTAFGAVYGVAFEMEPKRIENACVSKLTNGSNLAIKYEYTFNDFRQLELKKLSLENKDVGNDELVESLKAKGSLIAYVAILTDNQQPDDIPDEKYQRVAGRMTTDLLYTYTDTTIKILED